MRAQKSSRSPKINAAGRMLTSLLPWLLLCGLNLLNLAISGNCSPSPVTERRQSHRPVLHRRQFARQVQSAVNEGYNDGSNFVLVPLVGNLTTGRWFGSFAVGHSPPLELLIDTGSSDIILNPNRYAPSPALGSQDLHTNFTKTYGEYANSLEVGTG